MTGAQLEKSLRLRGIRDRLLFADPMISASGSSDKELETRAEKSASALDISKEDLEAVLPLLLKIRDKSSDRDEAIRRVEGAGSEFPGHTRQLKK